MVNFASLRSAYDVTMEAMNCSSLKTIAIIAEGIPENFTRNIIKTANEKVKKNHRLRSPFIRRIKISTI